MALVYFDASALVKLLVEEDGSDLAVELWDGCDAPVSSRLAYPEVRAALAAAQQNRDLEPADVATAERTFEEYWASVRPVELSRSVERLAGQRRCAARSARSRRCASRQCHRVRRRRADLGGLGPAATQ